MEKEGQEKKRESLSRSTVRITVLCCFMLGLIALIIGLGLYAKSRIDQYTSIAYDIADAIHNGATKSADAVTISKDVMEIYNGLSEEQRNQCGSEEYLSYFSSIDKSKGSNYETLMHMMGNFIQASTVDDVYLAMFDPENQALVYVVDPQEKDRFETGEWEHVNELEISKFMEWDGTGKLYDITNELPYGWMCTAGSPIRDGQGNICAFVLTDVGIGSIITGMLDYAIRITLGILVFTGLIAWLLTRHMKNRVIDPINQIAQAAEAYSEDKKAGAILTDRFSALNIQTNDELENLSRTMADMERDLSMHEEQLIKITANEERIGTELKMASLIQRSTLPQTFPAYPDRKEFDLYATMDAARQVGGDFYDFYLIDDDHLCIVIADVSGKGIPGSLFMMISKVIVQSCAMLGLKTAEILNKTNEALCSNNKMEMFVTIWLGILEISTGKIIAANAGHEYPFLNADGRYEVLRDKHGLVIGGMPDSKYEEYTIQMKPGDSLFIYTDGIPEANDPDKNFFGMERLETALNEDPSADCETTIANVKKAVDDFVKDADMFDDQTMLCLRYNGKQ